MSDEESKASEAPGASQQPEASASVSDQILATETFSEPIREETFPELPRHSSPLVPSDKPYDPNEDRESVRSVVAVTLLVLLFGTVVFSFLVLMAKLIPFSELKDLLTIVFGPIITLLGAVTGFYYGEKSRS